MTLAASPAGPAQSGFLTDDARQAETAAQPERLATVPRVAAAEVRPVWGNKMSGYYAYLTGDDGHITNRVTFLAAYDEEAKELAKQIG